ncbi:MAG: hypothetical protein MUF07_10935 [Steroidobacteraceae bacterium]|jgi:hypothetical protein|nr:hypothetical protein [Steroidobacteraceae bacterium]
MSTPDPADLLHRFVRESAFAQRGAVITDLDGTAVHEDAGRVVIPKTVSHGLGQVHALARPIVINTLRFPLNVIRTFGREWYSITRAPLPLVSLNGSLVGHLHETPAGEIEFEEALAFPLATAQVRAVLDDVSTLLAAGIEDLALFHYPRDWRAGEIVWTPDPARVPALRERYRSASEVFAAPLRELRERLLARELCMLLLLVEAEAGRLMAYQHVQPRRFHTAPGVDKLHGARVVAGLLGVELAESVGAGDTPMDNFLDGVGLAVQVGELDLPFHGRRHTLRVGSSLELGELLFRLADLHRPAAQA